MEENKKKKNKGINFFKKIWYATTKFDRYSEMAGEGIKNSTKYLIKIIFLMSLIISIIGIYDTNLRLDNGLRYMAQDIPNFKYSEEQLKIDVTEVIRERDPIFDLGEIIIDTETEDEEEIEEYKSEIAKSEKGTGIIILKNKIIQIVQTNENDKIKTNEISYGYVATTLLGKTTAEFTKSDVISFLDGTGRIYISIVNLIIYIIAYFISYFASTIVYVFLLTIIGNITGLILKLKIKFRDIYSISVYALTLPTILSLTYFIVKYFSGIQIRYFDIAYVAIGYIYLVTVIFLMKTDLTKKQEMPIVEETKEVKAERAQEELEPEEVQQEEKEQKQIETEEINGEEPNKEEN